MYIVLTHIFFVYFRIPLHLAIQMKNTGMVELLLEQGSPLETQSEEGFPPLWYALQELSDETREMAIQVIRKGASTNTVRKSLFRLRAEC